MVRASWSKASVESRKLCLDVFDVPMSWLAARRCFHADDKVAFEVISMFVVSIGVRLALFRSFCSPMYTSQLWWNYKKCRPTVKRLLITYHNVFKMSIYMSKYESTSVLCTVYIMCSVVRLSSEILCIVSCVGFRHPTIV